MSSLEARLIAELAETQVKTSRQFLKRIKELEKDNVELKQRIAKLERERSSE